MKLKNVLAEAAVSTDDCKKYLASFFSQNKKIATFFGCDDHDYALVCKESSWKRTYKRSAKSTEIALDGKYMIYETGCDINRFGEPPAREPVSNFTVERGFTEANSEGQLAFVVLERPDGTLALGNYIGD